MNKIAEWIYDIRNRIIFISVFVIGLFVHGSRFFTVYLAHDDLQELAGPGATFTSGRWFLHYLYILEKKIMGSHINAKGFIAIVSFALIAFICCIIAKDLEIQKTKSLILLSATVVTFPYVTGLFSYTFTANYYYISLLMSIVAASLIQFGLNTQKYWYRMLFCNVLLGLSMAVYQTSICTFAAYMMILAIKESLKRNNESWKDFMGRCITYLLGCFSSCLFYFISNKVMLSCKNLEMTSYQGLDQMGKVSGLQFVNRIIVAYKQFFFPPTGVRYSLFYVKSIRWCYRFILIALIIFAIIFIIQAIKKGFWNTAIQLIILFSVTPLAINSVFLTADIQSTNIHPLMMFGEVFVFISLLFSLEYVNWGYGSLYKKVTRIYRGGIYFFPVISLC